MAPAKLIVEENSMPARTKPSVTAHFAVARAASKQTGRHSRPKNAINNKFHQVEQLGDNAS
jgi:hypothetical protein